MSFVKKQEFDSRRIRANKGDDASARQGMEEQILQKDDRAADRDVEAHELYVRSRETAHVEADIPQLEENAKLVDLRAGRGTYGYGA